jgi:hypothetical protein
VLTALVEHDDLKEGSGPVNAIDPEMWKALSPVAPKSILSSGPAVEWSVGLANSLLFMPPIISELPMISLPQSCPADSDQPTLHPCNPTLYSMHWCKQQVVVKARR